MSNKELKKWLKKNRSYNHKQVMLFFKIKLLNRFDSFKFWKKNNVRNKRRLETIIYNLMEIFSKRGLISNGYCEIDDIKNLPVVGRFYFNVLDEVNVTSVEFSIYRI